MVVLDEEQGIGYSFCLTQLDQACLQLKRFKIIVSIDVGE
jgi:hypothetical protein